MLAVVLTIVIALGVCAMAAAVMVPTSSHSATEQEPATRSSRPADSRWARHAPSGRYTVTFVDEFMT
jgi:flagellar basal body-associated protein FliL